MEGVSVGELPSCVSKRRVEVSDICRSDRPRFKSLRGSDGSRAADRLRDFMRRGANGNGRYLFSPPALHVVPHARGEIVCLVPRLAIHVSDQERKWGLPNRRINSCAPFYKRPHIHHVDDGKARGGVNWANYVLSWSI